MSAHFDLRPPHVVGIGGTTRSGSSSEQALRLALRQVELAGGTTRAFAGTELAELPMYSPELSFRSPTARDLIHHLTRADALIIASPGYHGSISGMVKNALDYTEDMREHDRPYLTDRAVGLIVTAHGWQATVTTLESLRSVVHALRGWVTPYGATINSSVTRFERGECSDPRVVQQLRVVGEETARFARCIRLEAERADIGSRLAVAREAR
jgi:FMN reductase